MAAPPRVSPLPLAPLLLFAQPCLNKFSRDACLWAALVKPSASDADLAEFDDHSKRLGSMRNTATIRELSKVAADLFDGTGDSKCGRVCALRLAEFMFLTSVHATELGQFDREARMDRVKGVAVPGVGKSYWGVDPEVALRLFASSPIRYSDALFAVTQRSPDELKYLSVEQMGAVLQGDTKLAAVVHAWSIVDAATRLGYLHELACPPHPQ